MRRGCRISPVRVSVLRGHTVGFRPEYSSERQLLAQLKEIKRQGFATSTGERINGSTCISVPVNNYTYPTALSILGPTERLQPRVQEFAEVLKASAKRISDNISGIFT
jgi:IclR family KDG regulon transcriptional repressor